MISKQKNTSYSTDKEYMHILDRSLAFKQNRGHFPVMLNELRSFVDDIDGNLLLDATYGCGGYSRMVLENSSKVRVYATDKDPQSTSIALLESKDFRGRFFFKNSCFSKLDLVSKDWDCSGFDTIVFDLGLSSMQLLASNRGFSFNDTESLDMRINQSSQNSKYDAKTWLNTASEKEVSNVIFEFGEERAANKIAKAIVTFRKSCEISSAYQLSKIVLATIGKNPKSKINPATKTFQAIRIFINSELEILKIGLSKAIKLLNKGGKIIVVSFHSLEDRIVKEFFRRVSDPQKYNTKSVSRYRPSIRDIERSDKFEEVSFFKLITKKPIRPKKEEIDINPASRSAKMRVLGYHLS